MATLRNAILLPNEWWLDKDLWISGNGAVVALHRKHNPTNTSAMDVYAASGGAWSLRASFTGGALNVPNAAALNSDGSVLVLGYEVANLDQGSSSVWTGRVDILDWTGTAYAVRTSFYGDPKTCYDYGYGLQCSSSEFGGAVALSPDATTMTVSGLRGGVDGFHTFDLVGGGWVPAASTSYTSSKRPIYLRDTRSLVVCRLFSWESPKKIIFYSRPGSGTQFTPADEYAPTGADELSGSPGVAQGVEVIAANNTSGALRILHKPSGSWVARETIAAAAYTTRFALSTDASVLLAGEYVDYHDANWDTIIYGIQVWDLPPVLPPEVPDVYDLTLPLTAQVYSTEPVSLPLIASVGDALVSLPLIARVAHTGQILAPLIAVVRSPRFAVTPSPAIPLNVVTTAGPTTYNLTLPLVANVWDTPAVGWSGTVGMCADTGLQMCPAGNTLCNLSAQGMWIQYGWSICTVPFYVPPRAETETYTLTMPLLARVRPVYPVIAEYSYGFPANWGWRENAGDHPFDTRAELLVVIDRHCGPLILPLQLSGPVGLPGIASNGAQINGVSPVVQSAFPSFENDYIGGVTIGMQGVLSGLYSFADGCWQQWHVGHGIDAKRAIGQLPDYGIRLSTSENHHLRIETRQVEVNIWPSGLVSVERLDMDSGDYIAYTLTPRSGTYDVVGNPGFSSLLYTQADNTTVTVSGDAPADPPGETYDLELQLIAQVGAFTNTFEAVLYAQVYASGDITAPLIAQVYDDSTIVLPLIAQVLYPSFAVPGSWDVRVSLGGVDVTSRLLAQTVEIEAEAGMARVARFGLAPNGQPIDMALSGVAEVEVDYLPPGGSEWYRLFTGRLAEQDIDLTTRALTCTATDARTPDLDAMSPAEIEAITPGGLYSPSVQGADLTGAALADARVSTLDADLDRSPTGAWRLTPWTAAASPQFVLRESALVDESLSVQLMRFADVLNRVEVRFEYRYPALRERWARLSWAYAACTGQFTVLGLQPFWLTSEAIRSAAETGGWQVQDLVAGPYDGQLKTASWWQRIRYDQTVTEGYSLTVHAPLSVTAHGARQVGERSASLEAQYDTAAWAAATDVPVTLPSVSVATETVAAITDQTADGRTAADLAVSVLLHQARRDILASLRGGRVSATLPLNPLIDLPHTVRIESAGLVAQGRVISLRHELSGEDGRATTRVELAIYATPGGSTATDDLTPPAPPTLPAPDLTGFTAALGGAIALDSEPEPDWDAAGFTVQYRTYLDAGTTVIETVRSQFSVQLPAVPDADAQPLTLTHAATYPVTVPSDDFTLTH